MTTLDLEAIHVCEQCGQPLRVASRTGDPADLIRLECPNDHVSRPFAIGLQVDCPGFDTRPGGERVR